MAQEHLLFVTSCRPGDAGAITAFKFNPQSGALIESRRYTDIENPFFLALSPDRKRLYSTHVQGDFESDDGSIVAFAVEDDQGTLRRLNQQSTEGTTICYVDIDPSARAVVGANYSSGSVVSYPVRPDGSLGERASFFAHEGASMVNAARQERAHAHCAVISPGGGQVYACDLGTDQVMGYALDVGSAALTPLGQPYVRTIGGGGPRHFTIHPGGRFAYANNELANSVNVYRFDGESGGLAEIQVVPSLPADFDGDSFTADVKCTPDGRFLYCTNRGHDSIALYAIASDGRLELVEIRESLGNFPQNLAITPDGSRLLCANMAGEHENIAVFGIDAGSGRLQPIGEPTAVVGPSCIMLV